MTMDWLSTATALGTSLVKIGAPMLATVFLGPEAGALASVVINRVSAALGVPADPASITNAINADPAAAAAAVAPVEAEHKDAIEAYLADVANARSMTVDLSRSPNSWLGWVSTGITGYILLAFTAICILIITGFAKESNLVLAVYGTFSGFAGIAVQFWLGSTKGSSDKTDAVVNMARSFAPIAARKAAR